jgi:hypothetical protein
MPRPGTGRLRNTDLKTPNEWKPEALSAGVEDPVSEQTGSGAHPASYMAINRGL